MTVIVSCACGWQQPLDDEHQGRRARCPRCGGSVLVPIVEGRHGVDGRGTFRTFTVWASIAGVGLVVFFLVYAVIGEAKRVAALQAQAEAQQVLAAAELARYPMDPAVLGRAYRENEIAADRLYKGRMLTVRGRIGTISSGGLFTERARFVIQTPLGTEDIHCEFAAQHFDDLALLRPGANVVVQGRCEGVGPLGGVYLKGCRLMK